MNRLGESAIVDTADCDTVVALDGYNVRIVKKDSLVSHAGLYLFADNMKKALGKELLGFIEEALLAKSMKIDDERYDRLSITSGSIGDFRHLSPDSACTVNNNNAKTRTVEWPLAEKLLAVTIPINYDIAAKGTRTDIENALIAKIKAFNGKRNEYGKIDSTLLEEYGEAGFVYTGNTYLNKYITRNVYLNTDSISPLWDADYPLESISNLFIMPSDAYGDMPVELTILKHEYGEKESFKVSLNQLLAACEDEGCVAYWGVEKFEDGVLEGALFLYNQPMGYDHTVKVLCRPAEVIAEGAEITARAGLFIPTNNIHELVAPYIKKSDDEKIKYE